MKLKPICASHLRHEVTIEQPTNTNTDGVVAQTWSTFATGWAGIESRGGREYMRAKQIQAEMTHLVTMRYVAGVTPDMRLLLDGLTLNIISVENVERRDYMLKLVCKEAVT